MYALQWISDNDFPLQKNDPELNGPYGGLFNAALPNMSVIPADEFLKKLADLSLRYYEYRQMRTGLPIGMSGLIHATAYWESDGSGIAICRKMDGTTFYVKFAVCEHSFEHRSPSMFTHIYTCRKCRYQYTQDSSG
jgi:hypothetical protein